MDPPPKPSSTSLFQVYLRLRPPPSSLVQLTQQSLYPLLTPPERFLTVEPPTQDVADALPTHITIHAPSESRKRAVEKFAFTKVFEEKAEQLDIFKGTGLVQLIEGIVGEGRAGLLATLGVSGSGKVEMDSWLTTRGASTMANLYSESHYSRLEVTAWAYTVVTRRSLSICKESITTTRELPIFGLILKRGRCVGSPDTTSRRLLGRRIRRCVGGTE